METAADQRVCWTVVMTNRDGRGWSTTANAPDPKMAILKVRAHLAIALHIDREDLRAVAVYRGWLFNELDQSSSAILSQTERATP